MKLALSGSVTLKLAPLRVTVCPSLTVRVAAVTTGASLVAVMVTVVLPLAVSAPPMPCAPVLPSLKVQWICADAGGASLELL